MDSLTNQKTTESRKMSPPNNRTVFPSKMAWVGASLLAALGLIHLLEAPEELEEATYLGLLFLANFGGAVVAVIGIYRNFRWGWSLGALLAGGAFAGYVISRTIGLPGMDVEEWLEPLGVLSLIIEALFLGLWLATFARPLKG
jgi:uncharacterized membrane protein YfcA